MINRLDGKSYLTTAELHGLKKHWYGYARGFSIGGDIYINEDAFFIDEFDRALLLKHEEGHVKALPHELTLLEKIIGADHTLTGIMCPWGFVRWLTTWKI